MLVTLTLLVALKANVLKCAHDLHGKLIVTREQWLYIHQELESRDPKRVIELVHPIRDVKVRVVQTANAQFNQWKLDVTHETWSRADVVKKLTGAPPNTYDWRFPGYTYVRISDLSPEQNPKYVIGPDLMKGAMLYRDEQVSRESRKVGPKRLWRDFNRLAPVVYIKMTCVAGRLWLDEISSDTTID